MQSNRGSGYFKLFTALQFAVFVMALFSIFLPYVHRINIITDDPSIARTSSGWHFPLAYVSIGIIGASLFLSVIRKFPLLILFMSTLNLGIAYVLRMFIHSTMNIDDVYDTRTGSGFHLLLVATILLFKLSLINFLLNRKNPITPAFKENVLDS